MVASSQRKYSNRKMNTKEKTIPVSIHESSEDSEVLCLITEEERKMLDQHPVTDIIRLKILTARNILRMCRDYIDYIRTPFVSSNEKIQFVTILLRLTKDTTRKMLCSNISRKTFRDILDRPRQEFNLETFFDKHHTCILKLLHELYLTDHIQEIPDALLKKDTITTMIKLGNTKKAILTEKPELTYIRMKYMSSIKNYRRVNKEFAYISNMDDKVSLAICPNHNIVFSLDIGNLQDKIYKIEKLSAMLPKGAVIVLDARDLIDSRPLPNEYSTKVYMQEWLRDTDVIFDERAHTAELYVLIQKFKHKHKTTNLIRNLLESNGFIVLGLPSQILNLSFFHPITQIFRQNTTSAETNISFIVENVRSLEDALVINETKFLSEDLKLENEIEKIREAALKYLRDINMTTDFKRLELLIDFDRYFDPPYIASD